MRIFLDEDSQSRALTALLRANEHDVETVSEASLRGESDVVIFNHAQNERRVILTRNGDDFKALHLQYPGHCGILVEFQNPQTSKNLSVTDISTAIINIETSGWKITGEFVSINSWRFTSDL